MDRTQTILASILNPRPDGTVDFIFDGAISCDANGIITSVGRRPPSHPLTLSPCHPLILPPFLDAHIHIPQHPIRGHFMDGVTANPPEGRLIAGLNRNVFPAEAKCADPDYASRIIEDFAHETLSQGVVGGAAYMTIHPKATQLALSTLSRFWSLGLVLMEMNCPEYLRVDREHVEAQMRNLAEEFGNRYIVTDRFAVAVKSGLRQLAVELSRDFDLRMQTHLNEQLGEKHLVESKLYPGMSYTGVYQADGLLDRRAILAHCIHMRDEEWEMVRHSGSVVAHCPTSNTLLCSGIMPLDEVKSRGIEYAICTDVGASPTTSILAEMAQFLKVHHGRSMRATPQEALYRATLAPAKMLNFDTQLGSFEVGKPLSFIEVASSETNFDSADDAIMRGLLNLHLDDHLQPALDILATGNLDLCPHLTALENEVRQTAAAMEHKVISVTLAGEKIFSRS